MVGEIATTQHSDLGPDQTLLPLGMHRVIQSQPFRVALRYTNEGRAKVEGDSRSLTRFLVDLLHSGEVH